MNFPIVSRLLGVISLILLFAFIISAGIGYLYMDLPGEKEAMIALGWSSLIAAVTSFILLYYGRNARKKMFRKEALVVIGLGWILASLLGALPYLFGLSEFDIGDAVFESTSGLTTTGATVYSGLDQWPRCLLFWRAMSQWIGGMGVVVFLVAWLLFLARALRDMKRRLVESVVLGHASHSLLSIHRGCKVASFWQQEASWFRLVRLKKIMSNSLFPGK